MNFLLTALEKLTKKLDTTESEEAKNNVEKKEKAFRKRVDAIYNIATVSVSALTTFASAFFPPLAFIGAGVLLALSLLHYYDKKNNYFISHKISNIWEKLTTKKQPLVTSRKRKVIEPRIERFATLRKQHRIRNLAVSHSAPTLQYARAAANDVRFSSNRSTFFSTQGKHFTFNMQNTFEENSKLARATR